MEKSVQSWRVDLSDPNMNGPDPARPSGEKVCRGLQDLNARGDKASHRLGDSFLHGSPGRALLDLGS